MERARTSSAPRSGLRNVVFAGLLILAVAALVACGSSEGDAKGDGQEEPARAGPAGQPPAAPDTKGDGEEEPAKTDLAEQLPDSAAAKTDKAAGPVEEPLPLPRLTLSCSYAGNFLLDLWVGESTSGYSFKYDDPDITGFRYRGCDVSAEGGQPAYDLELFDSGMAVSTFENWDGKNRIIVPRPLAPGEHVLEATVVDVVGGRASATTEIAWMWGDSNRIAVKIRDHDTAEPGGAPIALTAEWRVSELDHNLIPKYEPASDIMRAVINRFEMRWDFGDGQSETKTVEVLPGEDIVTTVSHPYAREGTYPVSLTITDQYFGRTGAARAEVDVEAAEVAEIAPEPVAEKATEWKSVAVYVSDPWEIGNPSSSDYPRSGASGETGLGFIDVFWVRQGLDRPAYEWTFDFSFGSPYGTQPPGRTITLIGRGIREGGGDAPEDLEVPEIFFITNLPSENITVLDEIGPMEVGYGVLQKTSRLEVEIHIPEGQVGDRFTLGWGVTGCAEPCEYYWTYEGQ